MKPGKQPVEPSHSSASSQSTASSPNAPQEKSFLIAAPSISLPKGGGAIRGMGEKFAANPVTGTGSITVPIATSPGRSGFGPQLSLSYDSGSGNGPFGFGWSLSVPSITRKTDKGLPKYHDAEDSDVFILSGSEDLVPTLIKNEVGKWEPEVLPDRTVGGQIYRIRRYRPRIEGLFARIERWTNKTDSQDTFWRSTSKDNITTWYGRTAESRVQDPSDPTRIFSWLICQTHDDKGNVLVYSYKQEDSTRIDLGRVHERNRTDQSRSAQRYLKRIRYGNRAPYFPELKLGTSWPEPPGADAENGSQHWLFEAVFDYDEPHYQEQESDEQGRVFAAASAKVPQNANWPVRNDPFSSYRSGFEVRTYRLCQRVLMFHHFPDEDNVGQDCLVRSTDFTYEYEKDPGNARIPIYSFLASVTQSGYVRQGDRYLKKSFPPVEFTYSQPEVQDLMEEIDPKSVENLPMGLDGTAYQWTDLHGEGIPGILTEQGGAWFYKRNWSPISDKLPDGREVVKAKFSALETVSLKPNVTLNGSVQFMDLAGDGQPDLVTLDGPTPGLYEHDKAEGWEPFRPFTARLNHDPRDPNLKFVDLDGDGHADVLITEDDALAWHLSLAEEGFGPARRVAQALDEEKGPRLVFADGTQSVYLADLSGDGLTDLVRIRNGEVCYWPNLGYGRFGAKVTMDHAPHFDHPDLFDQKRIRLADIDGSGTTDIIYLHRDGIHLYFNQSGNSWSQPQRLKVFPRIDDLVSIVPIDLLGNGTACLVWSSPLPGDAHRQMRYVNLMGSRKPHLLIKTMNNLGAETRVEYAPSTKFYLKDKRDGNPWITKLPFPVHVVERVETYDHISRNRFVTRYAYHHGYFDGEEREFRGFGMVEQFDTEAFEDYVVGVQAVHGAQELTPELNQPPVTTRTWYHTGAFLDQPRILHQYRHEYYGQKQHIPEPILPAGLIASELRECLRALKGLPLRQEIYSYDGSAEQVHPYTVAENNFEIRWLQPRGGQRHSVFFPVGRESISLNYERNPADPRISHTFGLDLDDYGNARKSC
ncbi:MAG: FG-GAP-like repeat-containing protein, partial [Nitrospira sp.]|nr:FG-GAP-like repeat-containing protein [Nitrospira sp.]